MKCLLVLEVSSASQVSGHEFTHAIRTDIDWASAPVKHQCRFRPDWHRRKAQPSKKSPRLTK